MLSMDPQIEKGEGEEEEEEEEEATIPVSPSFPMGRVKRIVKVDCEIKKLNSEALFLISLSAELFLASLAASARDAAVRGKRRVVRLGHVRSAARSHGPTADFLLDSLPEPPPPRPAAAAPKPAAAVEKPLAPGARRIDHFLRKESE